MSLSGNSGRLTRVRHRCRKISFRVSRQWYERQYLEFLTCVQVLLHAIANGGCADTVRGQSALKVDPERKIPCRTWDSNSDAQPTELSPLDSLSQAQKPAFLLCVLKRGKQTQETQVLMLLGKLQCLLSTL